MITKQYLKIINQIIRKISKNQLIGYIKLGLPTQTNKPSPSGSLTINDVKKRLEKVFTKRQGYKIFTVENTNSMESLIDDNSLIVAKRITKKFEFRNGQWLIYDGNKSGVKNFQGLLILHQVIGVREDSVKMKGINNFFSDGWIPKKAFLYNVEGVFYAKQDKKGD